MGQVTQVGFFTQEGLSPFTMHRGWRLGGVSVKLFQSQWRVVALVAGLATSLVSDPKSVYSPHEKAYYADPALVEFVQPGLAITINSAKIAAEGTITTVYTISDPNGLPLDAAGVTTLGTVTLSYVAAVLPNNQEEYVAYTTRAASGPAVASTNQPGADTGGVTTKVGPGQYQYVFSTKAPSGFDATATHTIGIYASRVLTQYNLGTNYASAVFNFVPNGAKVTKTHDIIRTASCNACHDQLSHHGGRRRGIEMCVLCHTQQNVDTTTGGSLDLKVMSHEIHMGASLPSVVAGKPLVVNGSDFSKVIFPADPGDPRRCETCHSQTTGAAQATAYLTNPSRAACGACHNDVNFATGANHPGGIQNDDTQCSNCHIPQGELDFDASIKGAHVAPIASSLLAGLAVNITNVQNGTAGSAPVVIFTVQDKNGNGVALSALGSISLTMAGPTSDYGYTSFGSDVTTPGYVTESASGASCSANGTCMYTFTHTVPANATGTYAIGVEARRTDVVPALIDGTTSQQSITYGAPNKVAYFSVDGSPITPRREVVALSNCNGCHVSLNHHGELRNNTEYCVMCHNPSNTDAATRAMATVASDKAAPPQGVHFNLLVHRIHYGINQPSNRPYIVVGFGGSHNDFSGVLFPALTPTGNPTDTENCSLCHVNSTEQNNFALTGLNPVVDPQGPINPIQHFSSACTGCHMDLPTTSHTLANTTSLGESCAVCHSSGAAFAVDQVHAQY
ncbi:MAG TPA: OmcA/MtrC family decaheme c-type cytochrome [Bryobacteraceae bacterium]|nr:OmcA/MtrC family decaheme c-type cytochrome [Bryobacteraceae bacterium]